METFGDKLRIEREHRGLTIRAVAEILGADQDRLLALERNDFEALPDETTMVQCLHAYADCLRVDAELMIEDLSGDAPPEMVRDRQAIASSGERLVAMIEEHLGPAKRSASELNLPEAQFQLRLQLNHISGYTEMRATRVSTAADTNSL